jgi:hypothetical protein
MNSRETLVLLGGCLDFRLGKFYRFLGPLEELFPIKEIPQKTNKSQPEKEQVIEQILTQKFWTNFK